MCDTTFQDCEIEKTRDVENKDNIAGACAEQQHLVKLIYFKASPIPAPLPPFKIGIILEIIYTIDCILLRGHLYMMSSLRGEGCIGKNMTFDDKGGRGGPSNDDG